MTQHRESTLIPQPQTSFTFSPPLLRPCGSLPRMALILASAHPRALVKSSFHPVPACTPTFLALLGGGVGGDSQSGLLPSGPTSWQSILPSPKLVKVTQTNTVGQHFVFLVLCFRRGRGLLRPIAPQAPREHGQSRDLSHSPSLLRHCTSPRGYKYKPGLRV